MFAQSVHLFRQWAELRPEMAGPLSYELHWWKECLFSVFSPIELCLEQPHTGTGLAIRQSHWPVTSRKQASVAKWERHTDPRPPGSNDSAVDTGFNWLLPDQLPVQHWTRVDLIYFKWHIHLTPLDVTCVGLITSQMLHSVCISKDDGV